MTAAFVTVEESKSFARLSIRLDIAAVVTCIVFLVFPIFASAVGAGRRFRCWPKSEHVKPLSVAMSRSDDPFAFHRVKDKNISLRFQHGIKPSIEKEIKASFDFPLQDDMILIHQDMPRY